MSENKEKYKCVNIINLKYTKENQENLLVWENIRSSMRRSISENHYLFKNQTKNKENRHSKVVWVSIRVSMTEYKAKYQSKTPPI